MNRGLLLGFLLVSIAVNVFLFARNGRTSPTPQKENVVATAPKGLTGKVELNTTRLPDGEQVLQIVDHTREVICYAKIAPAGGSSISCQKFVEKKD